ncbi:MAG TPA: hypothetical protein VFF06_00495 [Polyangia bacterium]|nr:hypothetical protein [Polyangia bacterium]
MKLAGSVWLLVAVGAGCSSVKEYVPVRFQTAAPRIPNQQRIVAQAADEAVRAAASDATLNLSQYSGRSGRVEVNGVFPQSDSDLLDYIGSAVEGSMALAGMRVIARPPAIRVRNDSGGSTAQVVVSGTPLPEPPDQAPDLRVVASVSWGGIDFEDHKYVVGGRLAATILLTIFTLPVAGLGGLLYGAIKGVTGHTFTLKARVRITLRAIPAVAGLRAGVGQGEGSSQIVIDAESASGYAHAITIPEKKE